MPQFSENPKVCEMRGKKHGYMGDRTVSYQRIDEYVYIYIYDDMHSYTEHVFIYMLVFHRLMLFLGISPTTLHFSDISRH